MESVRQTSFGGGDSYSWTIARSGDLVCNMFLEKMFGKKDEVTYSGNKQYSVDSSGSKNLLYEQRLRFYAKLDSIKYNIEIGGQTIDKFDNLWRRTYNCLTTHNPTFDDQTVLQRMERAGVWNLPFWFCRNPGLALPLIALQYHEVKFTMDLNKANNMLCDPENPSSTSWTPQLWVDYIYLDTDERRRFAQVSHEYLIEQVQTYSTSAVNQNMNISLNFNHPVKELVWVHLDGNDIPTHHNYNDYGNSKGTSVKLVLNGQDRFSERVARYFSDYQVYTYHTGSGSLDGNDYELDLLRNNFINGENNNSARILNFNTSSRPIETRPVYVYSFALKPEEHQPSGTCNFSRIDNANLLLNGINTGNSLPVNNYNSESGLYKVTKTFVYAVNYNVLRVMSGMGGLAYSN